MLRARRIYLCHRIDGISFCCARLDKGVSNLYLLLRRIFCAFCLLRVKYRLVKSVDRYLSVCARRHFAFCVGRPLPRARLVFYRMPLRDVPHFVGVLPRILSSLPGKTYSYLIIPIRIRPIRKLFPLPPLPPLHAEPTPPPPLHHPTPPYPHLPLTVRALFAYPPRDAREQVERLVNSILYIVSILFPSPGLILTTMALPCGPLLSLHW